MAINLLQKNRPPAEPPAKAYFLSGFTRQVLRLGLWGSALIIGYLLITVTIIERETTKTLWAEIYDTAKQAGQDKPVERSPADRERLLVTAVDETLVERLKGYILIQVQERGEAWYVYPEDGRKYYLGEAEDAQKVMRRLGLGVNHAYMARYTYFPASMAGKILLDVEDAGKAYYIYPKDRRAYYLGAPADAYGVMRELGLGISNEDLRKITVGLLKD